MSCTLLAATAPHAMEGYWQRDDLTAETVTYGWLHTSDLARADEQGYLSIVDRKKDMVVSGGFNVYPRKVEDVLATDTRVTMTVVTCVPDAKWGEGVMAVVVPRAGATIDVDSLVRRVKERKGAQPAPKHVVIVDALPLTAPGKVDNKALRAPFWAGRDRGVA
jgi:fatty-acyl-CoA synthase